MEIKNSQYNHLNKIAEDEIFRGITGAAAGGLVGGGLGATAGSHLLKSKGLEHIPVIGKYFKTFRALKIGAGLGALGGAGVGILSSPKVSRVSGNTRRYEPMEQKLASSMSHALGYAAVNAPLKYTAEHFLPKMNAHPLVNVATSLATDIASGVLSMKMYSKLLGKKLSWKKALKHSMGSASTPTTAAIKGADFVIGIGTGSDPKISRVSRFIMDPIFYYEKGRYINQALANRKWS